MLDEIIASYRRRYTNIAHTLQHIEETGTIPDAELEGAPQTVAEATQALISMLVVLDRVLYDLNLLRMDINFSQDAKENNN